MTMRDFIAQNRDEIDAAIRRVLDAPCPPTATRYPGPRVPTPLTNEDRRQWILNDEGLYRWAKSEGVRI